MKIDKIFKPFFTTKPTGQACPTLFSRWRTGLGLSYDIVKAHGGELTVGTKEGEGATFVILLQFNLNGAKRHSLDKYCNNGFQSVDWKGIVVRRTVGSANIFFDQFYKYVSCLRHFIFFEIADSTD